MKTSPWAEARPGWAALAALAAGAAMPLAFSPFGWWPLALLLPAVPFLLWRSATPRRAALYGYLFGIGQFGVGVSWVYVAIHVFGHTPAPVAGVMTAVFVAVLSLYPALAGWLAARLRPRSDTAALLLLFPAVWLLVEWFRGWFLTGFPWLALGYAQIDAPLGGLAPLLGVYGAGLAAALSAGFLAWALLAPRRWLPVLGGIALLQLAGWGAARLEWTEPAGPPLEVAVIQGNVPQDTKWQPDQVAVRLERYATLTMHELGKRDLVVWPENAVTLFHHQLKEEYFDPLERALQASGTDLITGVPLLAEDGVRYFTTMMSLGSSNGFYLKHHLVPFGEFVPLEGLVRGLVGFLDLPMSSFSRGEPVQSPLSVAGQSAAVSICYEDAFGNEIIQSLPEATLLVNGSNNAWYGDSLAPHQHLQISRMRSLESGRPLVRSTTNGISALVDHRGEVIARSPQFETYVLTGSIQPRQGSTPFVAWGNAPALVLTLLLGLAGLVRPRRAVVSSPASR